MRQSPMSTVDPSVPRNDSTREEVEALFDMPFAELVFRAASVHRSVFDPAEIQLSQLLSVEDRRLRRGLRLFAASRPT